MKLQLSELQVKDQAAKKIKEQNLKYCWKEIERLLYWESLAFLPYILNIEIICKHHNSLLACYFGIKMTQELIAQKYYWLSLRQNIETYVKACNLYLASEAIRYKTYKNL